MKASLLVAEMDPSRIGVACRAVTHDLIPGFRAQAGAGCGYWMVNRTSGEILVLTTWDDEEALEAGRIADAAHRTGVAERIGLGPHADRVMDVVDADDVPRTLTAAARWARAVWFDGEGSARGVGDGVGDGRVVVAAERGRPGFCGGYVLGEAATGAGLSLSFWERQGAQQRDDVGPVVSRAVDFESVGAAGAAGPPSAGG